MSTTTESCSNCQIGGDHKTLQACSGCSKKLIRTLYCSIECQKKDWKNGHNKKCGSPTTTSKTKTKAPNTETLTTSSSTTTSTFKRPKLYTSTPSAALLRQLDYLESHPGVGYALFLEDNEILEIRFANDTVVACFRDRLLTGVDVLAEYTRGLAQKEGLLHKAKVYTFLMGLIEAPEVHRRFVDPYSHQEIIGRQLAEEYEVPGFRDNMIIVNDAMMGVRKS